LEFLEYFAAVKGLDSAGARRRIDELLVLVNLADVRKRPLGGFSGVRGWIFMPQLRSLPARR
jgi:ABC-2 type transport system ATP-binding protein